VPTFRRRRFAPLNFALDLFSKLFSGRVEGQDETARDRVLVLIEALALLKHCQVGHIAAEFQTSDQV
jgi:hypothetical protein